MATERWLDLDAHGAGTSQPHRDRHRFDVAAPGSTEYRATGRVPGSMLSQWSMSEHEGLLRVAATTAPPWQAGRPQRGERELRECARRALRAARRGRPRRRAWPRRADLRRSLHRRRRLRRHVPAGRSAVHDRSLDPAHPRTAGELKIPGYSAYLHPVGPGALLGVGQAATGQARCSAPSSRLRRLRRHTSRAQRSPLARRGSHAEVEYDHHAFLWWAPAELVVVPVQGGAGGEPSSEPPPSGSAPTASSASAGCSTAAAGAPRSDARW